MKRAWILALAAALPLCAQRIDYSFLDKLADKAKESSVVDLGPEQLSLLSGMQGKKNKGGVDLGELAKTLKAIQVRSYEFAEKGQYDLEIVRAFRDKVTSSGNWVNIISTKEPGGFTEIMVKKGADGKSEGFLIVAAEPREVSIVHIDGVVDLSALGKLGGIAGIPEIIGQSPKKSTGVAGRQQKQDDDEL